MEESKPVFMAQDMMLRDYFAAKTMQALISTGKSFEDVRLIAIAAYEMADLMVEKRDK